jgi:hypothetical protein
MNLRGSATELQNTLAQLYLKLEQRFNENRLVRELWSGMAHDILQQIASLKMFPPSFWSQLKKDQDELLRGSIQSVKLQIIEKLEDFPLEKCFELALYLEEPTILKIYVPVIRSLRKDWTNTALDFYIMVKAHLARIARATDSFSGDPITRQRSNLLLQSFEKEVQEAHDVVEPIKPAKRAVKPAQVKKPAEKPKKAPEITGPLAKHSKIHHNRTKPFLKKVELPRRQARG